MIEEYIEPKTHSIVSDPCELRPNHIGEPVTYKGVTGYLIRYITTCEHKLMELSRSEVDECLDENRTTTDI